ncbi:MAG: Haloalkane dehalogenase [Candidatus Heimdallarchaeota archaeon LC_2]|nr:MAG: Haloalkane dehalogenase [Candidatus Heimdallarchaeota archaeon LC_2]
MSTKSENIEMEISPDFPFESKFIEIKGSNIHYIDEGEGDPILFIHGNPTSSYLWRNIIPYLSNSARCIAPDLIGMGQSDKPDIDYGFHDSYEYLDGFISELGLENITLVIHDWGSGLGFHYANMHRDNIKAIAFMEAMYKAPNFDEMQISVKFAIKMMRNRLFGSLMVKRANIFIKKMLPDLIERELTKEEKAYYASPYPDSKSRNPLLAWPRSIPIKGKPADVASIVANYHEWLKETDIPKLCFYVSPGVAVKDSDIAFIKENFKKIKMIDLGKGLHFIQEDYPHEIGTELSKWYSNL